MAAAEAASVDAGASCAGNSCSSASSAQIRCRELDLLQWRLQQTVVQDVRERQRQTWESEAHELEEEVAARRHRLAGILELKRNRANLLREERIESENASIFSELSDAKEHVTCWRAEASRRANCVWELQSVLAKELLGVERRWSDTLQKRARCWDLEASLEERSVQAQRLTGQIQALELRMANDRQEAEHAQNSLALERQELEVKLHNARQAAEEVREHTYAGNLERSTARGQHLKQLRGEFQAQARCLSDVAESWRAESEEIMERAQSSRSGRRRARAGDVSTARKVAALRSAWHRQEEQGRRRLLELRAELYRERAALEDDESSKDWLLATELRETVRLAQKRLQLAEDEFSAISAKESEQEAELQAMEGRLAARPQELTQRLAAVGDDSPEEPPAPLPLLHKPLWPSHAQAEEAHEVATWARLHSKKAVEVLREEHLSETQSLEEAASEMLHRTLEQLRLTHNEELLRADAEQRRDVYMLQEELRKEEEAAGDLPFAEEVGRGVEEIERIAVTLEHKIRQLREDHCRCLEMEGAAHRAQLQCVLNEAQAAEQAYLQLRRALVVASQEAEYQHERAVEDQESKRHELAELCVSHSSMSNPGTPATAALLVPKSTVIRQDTAVIKEQQNIAQWSVMPEEDLKSLIPSYLKADHRAKMEVDKQQKVAEQSIRAKMEAQKKQKAAEGEIRRKKEEWKKRKADEMKKQQDERDRRTFAEEEQRRSAEEERNEIKRQEADLPSGRLEQQQRRKAEELQKARQRQAQEAQELKRRLEDESRMLEKLKEKTAEEKRHLEAEIRKQRLEELALTQAPALQELTIDDEQEVLQRWGMGQG